MPALAQTVDRPAGPVYKQGAAQQPDKANRSTFSVSQRDASVWSAAAGEKLRSSATPSAADAAATTAHSGSHL